MTSTELAIRDTGNGVIAERDVIDGWVVMASDVFKLASHIADTDFVPDAYRGNAPAVAAAILTGRELGIGPMTALRHVQVVKGSPSLSAEYKRARVLAAGHDLDILELNTTRCKVVGRRKGKPPLEITFTMDDAKRAGLTAPSRSGKPGSWQTRPRRMLFARASTEVCDFLFTDITNGLPTTELLEEGDDGEDAFAGYAESPSQPAPAAEPKPRTAQRRPRAQNPPPAPAAHAPAAAPAPPIPQDDAGGDLPPLPGEDEPDPAPVPSAGTSGASTASTGRDEPEERDYDTPGTATQPQLKAIWTILSNVYRFEPSEKDQARAVCAHIVQHDLASSADLSKNEAKAVLDTLGHWQHQAAERGEEPRDYLIGVMVAQDTGEQADDGE